MMIFVLIGLVKMMIKKEKSSLAICSFLLLHIYVVFSWHLWTYASSFGSRAMVESYAFLIIPFCYFIEDILKSKKLFQGLLFVMIITCCCLNIFQNWQYRKNIFPLDNNTKTYYWQVFGSTTKNI